jgi:hypothetical protein
MHLIKEINESVNYVVEEKLGKGKDYFIEGIFLQSNLKNKNGRVYSKPIMQNEVNRYTEQYIKKNRAYGELGHPDSPSINLDRVSHMIKELREDGDNYIGKAKIMDTPYGKIVKSLIDEGANLGVSSRGLGSLKTGRDGVQLVQDDFMLATAADIVADPSAPDAFVRGIMENADWILQNGKWTQQQFYTAKKMITEASRNDIEDVALKVFTNFISKL